MYRVKHELNYYAGSNVPDYVWATDEQGNELQFAARKEAQQYVNDYYNASSSYDGILSCNVLAHNQYASDTLHIRRIR